MRLSSGSAARLCLITEEQLTLPTTCYVLLGSRCRQNCAYCAQSAGGEISRIRWVEVDQAKAIERINKSDFERVCFQCADERIDEIISLAKGISKPLSISCNCKNSREVDRLIRHCERLCISLDCVSPTLYRKLRNGLFSDRLNLIVESANRYPGRVTTHVIAGLGETENEMLKALKELTGHGICVGLFAFTPVKGTVMQDWKPPDVSYYRRIQKSLFRMNHGFRKMQPEAFMTSGCSGCNRPYFNERPTGPIYNYPRGLTDEEFETARE